MLNEIRGSAPTSIWDIPIGGSGRALLYAYCADWAGAYVIVEAKPDKDSPDALAVELELPFRIDHNMAVSLGVEIHGVPFRYSLRDAANDLPVLVGLLGR